MEASYPLWIGKLPGIPRAKLSRAPLYPHKDARQLEQSLEAGPQFARLNWRDLLAWRADQLRIILIARQDYYAAQAAAHLTALDLLNRPWPGECRRKADESDPRDLSRHLTLVDSSVLCPEAQCGGKTLRLSKLNTPAVLICGNPFGADREAVLEQIEDAAPNPLNRPMHIFVVLHPDQIDPQLLANLQLRYSFRVGVVDEPDLSYLGRQLKGLTWEVLPVQENIDWEALVRRVQEIRGEAFVETDLSCIPALAIMNGTSIPASQEDLTPKLFDLSVIER